MNNKFHNEDLSENVILADGDYVDKVAFDLTVNFERMIGRRIPKADTARWIDCVALDGGLREGDNKTQVIIIHDKSRGAMENFVPGVYADELDGKAFSDNLGEFLISSLPVENDVTTAEDMFIEALEVICNNKNVKRIMVIPDAEKIYGKVRETLRLYLDDENKRATVFAMQPMQGGNFRQEILGYSLMQALGIKSSELHAE
ncbi:MAG: hypothetical protein OSJ56_10475 [Prevotella sp.]|uniref:DUF6621 family protein n=1 Tax=Prevotella sp. PTAC TaxID=2736295 RepID=UPI001554B8CA|nr:DUF6621 family protein [Prevotella sp. PTAC]MCX4294469.1 hypothetical protein [Prevotella sp.]NPD54059.1 hypothetical protein [Prevotella sp. PTAC]